MSQIVKVIFWSIQSIDTICQNEVSVRDLRLIGFELRLYSDLAEEQSHRRLLAQAEQFGGVGQLVLDIAEPKRLSHHD